MGERLLTALGAIAAAVAVIAGFALLFHVLDEGGDDGPSAATVIRVAAPKGGGTGRERAAASTPKPPRRGGSSSADAAPVPGGRTDDGKAARPGHASVGAKVPRRVEASEPAVAAPAPPPTLLGRPVNGPAFQIAHVREGAGVDLLSAPGGPIVAHLGDKTEFGSPISFSVVATEPGWLGVTAPELPNGELAWIARDPREVDVYWTRWSIHASLAGRSLELRYGDQDVRRFSVTIGGPGTETPPGRYGVTDGISFEESPYYGCCALALSGHQTHELPAGWIGGNRLAIHGTPGSVGNAESLGCIRATDETMRYLFHRVPLGTPVFIED
jgi:L,D-transpeptidase catalytic domain